jgi:hypothetical protein
MTCPNGHRLGLVSLDLRGQPRMSLSVKSSQTGALSLDPERGKILGSCSFCPSGSSSWVVPARGLAGLLAALLAYGGARSYTAPITGLRLTLAKVIPAGDPAARDRRHWFDQVIAAMGDTQRT